MERGPMEAHKWLRPLVPAGHDDSSLGLKQAWLGNCGFEMWIFEEWL